MAERKLAHIEKIEWIKPIEGADNIELIGVLGWVLISKIGEFKIGDLCVFFEIDSKLPECEWSEFLRPKHFKVKTYKLGRFSVISQGLALPIKVVFDKEKNFEIGQDVTEKLGVKYSVEEDNIRKARKVDPEEKYKRMAQRRPDIFKKPLVKKMMKHKLGRKILFLLFGKKNDKPKAFPTHFEFVHKTDETRVENMPWVLENKTPLCVSEKLDGTSSTYILERKKKGFEFYVLSRNVRQLTPNQTNYHNNVNGYSDNIYWNMAIKYDIENHLKEYLNDNPELSYVSIQGESIGNVQGNPYKLKEDDLYVFNFIDSKHGRISSSYAKPLIEKWGMKWVPILDKNYILPDTMEEFKEYATARSMINPNVLREGVVLRNYETGLSFKNVSREYLLKHNL